MTIRRRLVLFLVTMLMAPLALVATATPAQALGQRTQTWNTGTFKASITVNWTSKHAFTMGGWIEDTKCDSRGVYISYIYEEHKKKGGGYELGSRWYIGAEDDNGCNNGRVTIAKHGYTAGKQNVPLLYFRIASTNTATGSSAGYVKTWNNPYIDG